MLQLFKSLAERSSSSLGQVPVKVTAYEDNKGLSTSRDGLYDLMLFPSGIQYSKVPLKLIGLTAVHGLSAPGSIVGATLPPAIAGSNAQVQDMSRHLMIFVCCHGSRDARCGRIGPAVVATLGKEITSRGLDELVQVFETSHLGGHKYAGNVIVYCSSHPCDGDWYGGINLQNASEFLDALLSIDIGVDGGAEDDRLRFWWRGRMGLTKADQRALWECGGGVEHAEIGGASEADSSHEELLEQEEFGGNSKGVAPNNFRQKK